MTSHLSRREVLLAGGKLALTTLTLGTLSFVQDSTVKAAGGTTMNISSFGWKFTNLFNDGGNVVFSVKNALTLNFITMDASIVILGPGGPSPVEVLLQVAVGQVGFGPAPNFYINTPPDPNIVFGGLVKGGGLTYTAYPPPTTSFAQNVLIAMPLKLEGVGTGDADAVGRNVTVSPNLALKPGDLLVCHVDHSGGGTQITSEMQLVIGYS